MLVDGGGRRYHRRRGCGCPCPGTAGRRVVGRLTAAAAASAAGAARSSPAPTSGWPPSLPAAYSSDVVADRQRHRDRQRHKDRQTDRQEEGNRCQCVIGLYMWS